MEVNDSQTQKAFEKQIERLADRAFKKHVLRRESEISWYCHAPGTRYYGFWLAFLPYHIALVGDIGGRIFKVDTLGSLPWLLGAVDSMSYVLGKSTEKDLAFLVKETKTAFTDARRDADADYKKRYKAMQDEWDEMSEQNEHSWRQLWWDHLADCEPPSCSTFSSSMRWHYYALVKFCELYQAQINQSPAPVMQHPEKV